MQSAKRIYITIEKLANGSTGPVGKQLSGFRRACALSDTRFRSLDSPYGCGGNSA